MVGNRSCLNVSAGILLVLSIVVIIVGIAALSAITGPMIIGGAIGMVISIGMWIYSCLCARSASE